MKGRDVTSIFTYAEDKELTPREIIILQGDDEKESRYFSFYIKNLKNIVKKKMPLKQQPKAINSYLFYMLKSTKDLFKHCSEEYFKYTLYIYKLAVDEFIAEFDKNNPLNKKVPYLKNIYDYKLMLCTIQERGIPKAERFQDENSNLYLLKDYYYDVVYRQDDISQRIREFERYFDYLHSFTVEQQRLINNKIQALDKDADLSLAFFTGSPVGVTQTQFRGAAPSVFLRVYATQEQSFFDYVSRRDIANTDYKLLSSIDKATKKSEYRIFFRDNRIDFSERIKKINFESFEEYLQENHKNIPDKRRTEIISFIEKEREPYVNTVKIFKESFEKDYEEENISFFKYMSPIKIRNLFNIFIKETNDEKDFNRDELSREMEKLSTIGYPLMAYTEIARDFIEDIQGGKYDNDNLLLFHGLCNHIRRGSSLLRNIPNRETLLYFQYGLYLIKECLNACCEGIKDFVENEDLTDEKNLDKDKLRYMSQLDSVTTVSSYGRSQKMLEKFFKENKKSIFDGFKAYLVDEDFDQYRTADLKNIKEVTIKYIDGVVYGVNKAVKDVFSTLRDDKMNNLELSLFVNIDASSLTKVLRDEKNPELFSIYLWNLIAIEKGMSVLEILPKGILTDKDRELLEILRKM